MENPHRHIRRGDVLHIDNEEYLVLFCTHPNYYYINITVKRQRSTVTETMVISIPAKWFSPL